MKILGVVAMGLSALALGSAALAADASGTKGLTTVPFRLESGAIIRAEVVDAGDSLPRGTVVVASLVEVKVNGPTVWRTLGEAAGVKLPGYAGCVQTGRRSTPRRG